MIDTIVLTLTKDMYSIEDPDMFMPSASWAMNDYSASFGGIQSKQYPTKKDLLSGTYKPRLTLSNRITTIAGQQTLLKIEVSLPKLLFGNNFDELKSMDFERLMKKLSESLMSMGLKITPTKLAKAPVASIHYSKNIPITDGSTPYHYINKIKESNIKLSLDVNETNYRNAGHGFKLHTNSYEIAFYDKIRDLEQAIKSSKRSLEKDNDLQLDIFNKLARRKKFEVLRMEVRLTRRQKIKDLFKSLGIKSDFTLQSLFKVTIAKKVLLHYIDQLESKRSPLLDYKATSDKALLADLIFNNPELGPKQILQMFGFRKALENISIRELRVIFASCNQRSWYRLINDVSKLTLPNINKPFTLIRECLLKFKALKLNNIY